MSYDSAPEIMAHYSGRRSFIYSLQYGFCDTDSASFGDRPPPVWTCRINGRLWATYSDPPHRRRHHGPQRLSVGSNFQGIPRIGVEVIC